MFYVNQISGRSLNLPPKTLCLTYDDGPGETNGDGPGPRSLELAQYFHSQNIPATFFLTARHACEFQHVIPRLRALGHLVGNHGVNHHYLPEYLGVGGDLPAELALAEPLVTEASGPKTILRPPYGAWSPEVCAALNRHAGLALSHLGPINWDVNAEDWNFWLNQRDPEPCARKYFELISRQTTGAIVLMHDSTTDIGTIMRNNRTLEVTRLLVPMLQNTGYQFIRLDFALKLNDGGARSLRIALRGSNGQVHVSPRNLGGGEISVNSAAISASEKLRARLFKHGIITLQAANGAYLSPGGADGKILATAPSPEERNSFVLTSLDNRLVLRTFEGHYLAWRAAEGGAQLVATSLTIAANALFEFVICEDSLEYAG